MHHHHLSDDVLLAGIDGELTGAQREAFDAALAACAECRARVEALRRLSGEAAMVLRGEDDGEALARSRGRLRVAMEGTPASTGFWTARSWQKRWLEAPASHRALAAAAVLVLAIGTAALVAGLGGRGADADAAVRAALPEPSLTPGAWSSVHPDELCAAEAGTPPVPEPVRRQVLASYGMEHVPAEEYELDYLVTPELGGVPDPRNLWPQRYMMEPWNALVKDELERLLVRLVCTGRLELRAAQTDMATDWVAAYRKYFRTREPLRTHVLRPPDDRREPPRSSDRAAIQPDRT